MKPTLLCPICNNPMFFAEKRRFREIYKCSHCGFCIEVEFTNCSYADAKRINKCQHICAECIYFDDYNSYCTQSKQEIAWSAPACEYFRVDEE